MGIISGGVRLRRYEVLGDVPQGFRDTYDEAIRRLAFTDFGPDDAREQAVGWVPADDWFDPNHYLDRWLVGNTIVLTLRIDTKRVPSAYLKQECRKQEAEWKVRADRADLTRAERDEVRQIVTRRLLERVIPSCQGLDMAWDLDRAEVLFWSTAEKTNEAFRALFEKTFGVKLRPLFPYALALRALGTGAAPDLEAVLPTPFAVPGRR
jgi:recombination associated protein RdgC